MNEHEIARIAEDATKPTYSDVSAATNVILSALNDGNTLDVYEVTKAVCTTVGIADASGGSIDVGMGGEDDVRNAPVVKYVKVLHATRLSIARLRAQGIIVPVQEGASGREYMHHCKFTSGNQMFSRSGSVPISIGQVLVPTTFRLTPGLSAVGELPLLTVEKWEADVKPLINDRLRRILGESLDAALRGSYLSAVTLIGAVLEGAWYTVGEALRGRDKKLDEALDQDRTATVQTKVAEILRGTKKKAQVDGLESFAAYLRAVRNYGIHPTAGDTAAAETSFTEAGSYSLIQRSHSHLVQLLATARMLDPALLP